jgi:hypothetical protein
VTNPVITYPNGDTLTTTAQTPQQMSTFWQSATCSMLGQNFNPSLVRIAWQIQGQPQATLPNVDVIYVACFPEDVPYSRVRDIQYAKNGDKITGTWGYSKGWRVHWMAYGPNSSINTHWIWSAMFEEWVYDLMTANHLYPITSYEQPTRIPELVNGQWWERSDFSAMFYENVTEVLTTSAAKSVQVEIYDGQGQVMDIQVP